MGGVLTIPDLIGYCGVAFVVATYFLIQIGRMDATRALYPGLNAVGAMMILVSLYHHPNLPSVVIEFFWLAISLIGFARAIFKKTAR